MPTRFRLVHKSGKKAVVEETLPIVVIPNNLRHIDLRLKKAKLTEFRSFVSDDAETWFAPADLIAACEKAQQYLADNVEVLAFSDLVLEELPTFLEALKGLPKKSVLRLGLFK